MNNLQITGYTINENFILRNVNNRTNAQKIISTIPNN